MKIIFGYSLQAVVIRLILIAALAGTEDLIAKGVYIYKGFLILKKYINSIIKGDLAAGAFSS